MRSPRAAAALLLLLACGKPPHVTKCVGVVGDDQDCGACGHACPGAQHCVANACVASKIEHVVLIVQENHTFDAYFGRYCTAPTGSAPSCTSGPGCCEAAPAAEPSGSGPYVLDDAFNLASDPNHSQACELQEINGGKMDQFAAGATGDATTCASACSRPQNFALADASTVGAYWQLAAQGALADHYFQPIVGSTSSNDMYFAIAHEQFVDNKYMPAGIGAGCIDPTGVCVTSQKIAFSGRTTIADVLRAAGATFAAYVDGYAEAVAAAPNCPAIPSYCTWDNTHPLNQRSCLYDPSDNPFAYYAQLLDDPKVMKDYADLARDVAAGKLPSFAYVKARTYRNEHPGVSKISDGVAFVTEALGTIENSPYAADTLVLLTWDEGGGFYDHLAPSAPDDFDNAGVPIPHGTRVPLIALGPFARTSFISHVTMNHSSIVRFLEYNFAGPTGQLGYADDVANDLGSLLDPAKTGIHVPETR